MIASIEQLVKLELADLQRLSLPLLDQKKLAVDVLRLDKIHPIISGNKWFKLKYNLQQAIAQNKDTIITIGGAYSNHILATAAACKEIGLKSIGLIKGEPPKELSCTLTSARDLGMDIEFKARNLFQHSGDLLAYVNNEYANSYFVEEGGRNHQGVLGAKEILKLHDVQKYKYICCSIGTGTMMAGIVNTSLNGQEVLGFCSLKISERENELSNFLAQKTDPKKNYEIIYDYHFGGYARYNKQLIEFMNDFYAQTSIPTDFVYTGKLIYGVLDLAQLNKFEPGISILIIHSGGLQGNCSLPIGTLLF